MIKVVYIEQLADVIAHKCSFYYNNTKGELVEIPYENAIDLTIRSLLNLMDIGNLFYRKT